MGAEAGRAWGVAVGMAIAAACGCAATVARVPAASASLSTSDLLIDSIDGDNMREGVYEARTRFVVAPGWHEIGVSRHTFGPGIGPGRVRSEYATVCIDAVAGHSYVARPVGQADGSWTTAVFDATSSAPAATTCTRPPPPIVAADGPGVGPGVDGAVAASAAAPPAPVVAALTAPISDPRPDHPGTGLALRAGYGFGGDTLAIAQSADGDTTSLDAGDGLMVAVAGALTPFWPRRALGFGAGVELGWKYGDVGGGRAHASLRRFPLLATIHLLARLSGSWWVKLGGGIEKHFDTHYADPAIELSLTERTGPAGELGLYRRFRRHGAVEASLRYSRVIYDVAGASIDGSGVAMLLALHYDM